MTMDVVQPRLEPGDINLVRVPPRQPVAGFRLCCGCPLLLSFFSLLLSLLLSLSLSLFRIYHCTLSLLFSLLLSHFSFLPYLVYLYFINLST